MNIITKNLLAITLGFIFSIVPLTITAACLGHDATSTAKAFFEQHYNFYYKNPKKIANIVSSQLYTALLAEYRCTTKNKGICTIDVDPWTDTQDGNIDIHKPIAFSLYSTSPTTAVISINYTLILSKTQHIQQHILLHLERKNPNTCWLISDLISPHGDSLLKLLKAGIN